MKSFFFQVFFFFVLAIMVSTKKNIFQMKKYYKLKQKHPKLFEDLFPISVRHVYEQDIITLLPLRHKNGARILLMEVGSKICFHLLI